MSECLVLDRWFPEADGLTLADFGDGVAALPPPIARTRSVVRAPVVVEGWRASANCRDTDPGLFFPARNDMDGRRQAKAVCAGCSVRVDCLDYALSHGEKHGIFGGKTYTERRKLSVSSMPATGWPA